MYHKQTTGQPRGTASTLGYIYTAEATLRGAPKYGPVEQPEGCFLIRRCRL